MNKTKILIISLTSSILLFLGVIFIERKMVKYTPMVKVVYCVKETNRRDPLNQSNFIMKDVPITEVNIDTVKSMSEITDKYAKETIYAKEKLNRKRIASANDIDSLKLEPGQRELALNLQSVEDSVGGTLRKDDKVDIIYTSNVSPQKPVQETQTLLQNVKILSALDSSGKVIDMEDKDLLANVVLVGVSPIAAHTIANLQTTGKIKLVKVSEKGEQYAPITVVGGQVAGVTQR